MKPNRHLFFIFLFFSIKLFSQTIIEEKVDRRISISPYISASILPSNPNYDQLKLPHNLYGGYGVAPGFGTAIWYRYKPRIRFGTDIGILITSRDINSLIVGKLGLQAKFNIIAPKKRISPYLVAGFNFWFVNVNRDKQINSNAIVDSDSSILGDGTKTRQIDYKYNELAMYMAPMAGPMVGGGIDIKISRKISIYLQATIQNSVWSSSIIKSTFPENKSPLQYMSLQAGMNIKLFHKMKFRIDTQAVNIPDAIVMLYPPEIQSEKHDLLSREGSFSVNLREGLRHSLQLSVNDSEINIIMDNEGSPCKTKAILQDQFGNNVAEAVPDEKGNVNFKNLEKGVYDVVFQVEPPCHETHFSYKINSGGNDLMAQGNEEYTPESDSLAYNIEGMIDVKSPAPKANVQVLLVNQDTKQIISTFPTKKNGAFSFKNMKPGNYKVIYEPPAGSSSKIAYNVRDNHNKLVKQEDFPFVKEPKNEKGGTRLMGGNLKLNDSTVSAYKIDINFIDPYNRVVNHSIPNEDGSFAFIGKERNNDFVYQLKDKKLEEKMLAAANPQPLVRSLSYEPLASSAKKSENITAAANSLVNNKMNAEPKTLSSEMEMYKLYNIDGQLLGSEGFGYQVGAFRNLQNVYILMEKLKSEGFEVYTQSLMTNDINTRFKTSQNFKLNRVIVFAGNNENRAGEIKDKLIQEGYPIIVKEHFKTTASAK